MGRRGRLRSFFRTPKGLLLIVLLLLAAIAAPAAGVRAIAPGVASSVIVGATIDALILRARRTRWTFPDGAVLTALFIAMVSSAYQPWPVTALTTALAVLSKYAIRSRAANVFNPAALAIVASVFVAHTGQSWWGALPDVWWPAQAVLLAGGLFIADRVNRMPLVLAFLGAYYLLFTVTAFAGDPARVAEVFRTPDVQAALFFAFFILTDPPTSPVMYRDQLVCGAIVACVAYGVYEWNGAVYYLLAGVLAGNVWEAWRRVSRRLGHSFPKGIGAFLREISPWRVRAPAPVRA